MRRTQHTLIILALTGLLHSCIFSVHTHSQPKGKTIIDIPYPQPLPDSTAIIFLPNLVSKDSLDFNAASLHFFIGNSLNTIRQTIPYKNIL